jgi:hypothetical protein
VWPVEKVRGAVVTRTLAAVLIVVVWMAAMDTEISVSNL